MSITNIPDLLLQWAESLQWASKVLAVINVYGYHGTRTPPPCSVSAGNTGTVLFSGTKTTGPLLGMDGNYWYSSNYYGVIEATKPGTMTLTYGGADGSQSGTMLLWLYLFNTSYFQLGNSATGFPVAPKNPPAGYPTIGADYYLSDAMFSTLSTLGPSARGLNISYQRINYLAGVDLKTAAIWPSALQYNVANCRILNVPPGGTLFDGPGGSGIVGWQNLTGQPPVLTSLGPVDTGTPFIWPGWEP